MRKNHSQKLQIYRKIKKVTPYSRCATLQCNTSKFRSPTAESIEKETEDTGNSVLSIQINQE